ncbi:MAG: HAD hydrolase family protein [Mariprofundales bacterium]
MNKLHHPYKSKIVIFTDLDDTLIQTKSKLPEHALTTLAATDREGKALSFFTQSQKVMLDMFTKNGACIIPITGRNTDALNRVQYQFHSFRSVSHGAIVLKDDKTVCENWLSEIELLLMDWPELLEYCNKEINQIIKSCKLDARTRVIIDMDIPAYISVKGTVQALETIKQNNPLNEKFNHHENGRNHALLPPYASKKKAVEYIKKQLELNVNDLIIGIGDSLSDLDFMSSCQFSMMPVNSQITKKLLYG